MKFAAGGTRLVAYLALNLACCVSMLVGAMIAGGSLAELPYVVLLLALCSSPILFISRINDKFALLGVLMATFFMLFGLSDFISMFSPATGAGLNRGLSETEVVILIGAAMQLLGFFSVSRLAPAGSPGRLPEDWPRNLLVPIGLALWAAGNAATLFQTLVLFIGHGNMDVAAGLAKLGSWSAVLLFFVSKYAGPLGIIILSYWWCVWDPRGGTAIMLLLIVAQVIVGWVVDTKEVALAAPLAIILTRTVCVGKLPVRWILGALIGLTLFFPIMTAKRIIMTEDLGLTASAALPRAMELLWRSIEEQTMLRAGKYTQNPQTFIERSSLKPSVELLVRNVGVTHRYQMGSTLEPMLYTFMPRILLTDTRSANSAQTFNREFQLSEDPDTYMSMSHLGEWYWNFGLVGVIVGMALAGAAFGIVAVKCNPALGVSVTRVLVVVVTLYELAARGEGQISVQYVVWARSLLVIGALHLLLAQPRALLILADPERHDATPLIPDAQRQPSFRNLMP